MAEETYNQREHMEQVVAEGGSVYHKRAIISKHEHLPSQAELAKGDKAAEGVAREDLQRRRSAIDDEIAQLDSSAPAENKSPPSEDKGGEDKGGKGKSKAAR